MQSILQTPERVPGHTGLRASVQGKASSYTAAHAYLIQGNKCLVSTEENYLWITRFQKPRSSQQHQLASVFNIKSEIVFLQFYTQKSKGRDWLQNLKNKAKHKTLSYLQWACHAYLPCFSPAHAIPCQSAHLPTPRAQPHPVSYSSSSYLYRAWGQAQCSVQRRWSQDVNTQRTRTFILPVSLQ